MTIEQINQHTFSVLSSIGIIEDSISDTVLHSGRKLYRKYVSLFEQLTDDESFLIKTYNLFLWAHFSDIVLDSDNKSLMENGSIIRSFFLSNCLYSDYFEWVKKERTQKELFLFVKMYSEQLLFQLAERKWDNPSFMLKEYILNNNYWKKVGILLYPVLLLGKNKLNIPKDVLFSLLCDYHIYHLVSDDITDYCEDIIEKKISFISACYFANNGKLPNKDSCLDNEVNEAKRFTNHKLERLIKEFNNLGLIIKKEWKLETIK